jgi:hypothetical protein
MIAKETKQSIIQELVDDLDMVANALSKSGTFQIFKQEEPKQKLLMGLFIEARRQFYFRKGERI